MRQLSNQEKKWILDFLKEDKIESGLALQRMASALIEKGVYIQPTFMNDNSWSVYCEPNVLKSNLYTPQKEVLVTLSQIQVLFSYLRKNDYVYTLRRSSVFIGDNSVINVGSDEVLRRRKNSLDETDSVAFSMDSVFKEMLVPTEGLKEFVNNDFVKDADKKILESLELSRKALKWTKIAVWVGAFMGFVSIMLSLIQMCK